MVWTFLAGAPPAAVASSLLSALPHADSRPAEASAASSVMIRRRRAARGRCMGDVLAGVVVVGSGGDGGELRAGVGQRLGGDPLAHVEALGDVAVLEQEVALGLDGGDEVVVEGELEPGVDLGRVGRGGQLLG